MIRRVSFRRITIVRTRMPPIEQPRNISSTIESSNQEEGKAQHEVNTELQWFCSSLGLFGLRDKDKSCFRIFVELLKGAKEKTFISSSEIGLRTGLARGTVIHHLKNMMASGIIISTAKGYRLRVDNLEKLIDEIERDAANACGQLRLVAKKIDEGVGLK